jgi:hypothetical protein
MALFDKHYSYQPGPRQEKPPARGGYEVPQGDDIFAFPCHGGGGRLPAIYPAFLLLALLAPADVPRITDAVERSLGLASLTHRDAQCRDGQRVRIRVDLESLPGDAVGAVVYDCVSPDDVNRRVWPMPGQKAKDVTTVEGLFRLRWRAPGNCSFRLMIPTGGWISLPSYAPSPGMSAWTHMMTKSTPRPTPCWRSISSTPGRMTSRWFWASRGVAADEPNTRGNPAEVRRGLLHCCVRLLANLHLLVRITPSRRARYTGPA